MSVTSHRGGFHLVPGSLLLFLGGGLQKVVSVIKTVISGWEIRELGMRSAPGTEWQLVTISKEEPVTELRACREFQEGPDCA